MSTLQSNPSPLPNMSAVEKETAAMAISHECEPSVHDRTPAGKEKPSAVDDMDVNQGEQKKSANFKIAFFMLCLVSIVVAMDSVIVAATLPAIIVDLKGTSLEAFWVGTSYLLAQTIVIPLYGTISGIFGRKWVMVFAILLFTLGSILCATARSITWLVGARVVQGMGGGGVLSLVTVIITDITSLRERAAYQSMISLAWAFGTNIGVPVGGAIGQYSTWPVVFWINLPICLISAVGLIFHLHLHTEISSLRSKVARIDFLGILIFIASTTLFLYGLTTGGVAAPWASAQVLVPLVLGAVGMGCFFVVERWVAKEPMVPMVIFENVPMSVSYFGAFAHGFVLWTMTYYLIIFFLGAKGHALFLSSAETLPGTTPVAFSSVITGLIVRRTLHYRTPTFIGWTVLVLGTALNTIMHPDSIPFVIYGLRIISGIGGGILFLLPILAINANCADEHLGIASAMSPFFRSVGQAFGVAVGGTVFANRFDALVSDAVSSGSLANLSSSSSSPSVLITGITAAGAYPFINALPSPIQEIYRGVYADALISVWWVCTGIAAAGLVASLWVGNTSLDRGGTSKQGFDHGHGKGKGMKGMGGEAGEGKEDVSKSRSSEEGSK